MPDNKTVKKNKNKNNNKNNKTEKLASNKTNTTTASLTTTSSAYYSQQTIGNDIESPDDAQVPGVLKSNINGIFATPYQFLDTVDPRIEGTEIGRKYAEKIVTRMPLLFLTPCKQKFMADFDKQDKEAVLNGLLNNDSSANNVNSTGKYYTTDFDYTTYYNYVNKAMVALCYFTGLGDKRVGIDGNKKLKNVDWQNATNDSFKKYFNAEKAVVFYLDGLVSMNDSFSNSTTESSLSSTINGFSDTANELKFLLGENSALTKAMQSMGDIADEIGSVVGKFSSNLTGGMLSDLASTGVSTVLSGGKIIFPKLWQTSDFSRSYSFDIKLRSPDHDSLSILLNVLAPYVHLLCMVLPRNLSDNNPNAFSSPFLVKAYCKGMFNIDMGIITDLSVTRGAECQWNDDGLPTQIDISITIEDLYHNLFMTDSKFNLAVTNNTAMMDFLANMAGLNLAQTEFARSLKMAVYETKSSIARLPSTLWNSFDNAVANLMVNAFRKIGL